MAFFRFLPIVGVGVRGTGDGERCDWKIILDPLEGRIPFVVGLLGSGAVVPLPFINGSPFIFPFPFVRWDGREGEISAGLIGD